MITKANEQYRQGDVYLVRVNEISATLTLTEIPEGEPVILAFGEVTGHSHKISHPENVKAYRKDEAVEVSALEVMEAVMLLHEEHNPIQLPPGKYVSIIQVESRYDWAEARRVRD